MRQISNFENKTLQDRKFGPKMEDEIFLPKNQMLFEIKLPLHKVLSCECKTLGYPRFFLKIFWFFDVCKGSLISKKI